MTFVEWNHELSVHVEKIDEQHQKLFGMINHAYRNRARSGFIKDALNELMEYTRVHFTTEEDYFSKCGYDGAEEHIREHAKFTTEAMDFHKRFNEGEDVTNEFLEFLKEWWLKHVKTMDHAYVENFKICGLK